MRWSENETLQFVRIYLKHDFLFDAQHPDYKIREKREDAYNDIIAEFRAFSGILLDTDEVKTKIKNLRSTYTQEITKILQRSKHGTNYKPSMKWFHDWHNSFKNLSRPRLRSLEDGDENTLKMWSSYLNEEAEAPDTHDTSTADDPFVPDTDDNYIYIVKPEPKVSGIKREHPDSTKPRKKRGKRRTSVQYSIEYEPNQEVDSLAEPSKEDEFDIYGKYIASQLRQMELAKALRLQLEIQSLVSQARIGDSCDT